MNNQNILAFYPTFAGRGVNKWYSYGQEYAIPTPVGFIPPFQIKVPALSGSSTVELIELSTGNVTDIKATMIAEHDFSGLQIGSNPINLINYSTSQLVGSFNLGFHYLKIVYDRIEYWSENFSFMDTTPAIKIDFWHNETFAHNKGVFYYDGFKHSLYVNKPIGKPSYEYEEEIERRNGFDYTIQQISFKRYRFEVHAPEWLCDAIRLIRLHDNVEITYEGEIYSVDSILPSFEWDEVGYVCRVEFEFTTDTVVSSNGKPNTVLMSDYNDDYNDDYY